MATASTYEVTRLLLLWNDGDQRALERRIPLVHDELRRIARRFMFNERLGQTLQPSALINEAWRLSESWLRRRLTESTVSG